MFLGQSCNLKVRGKRMQVRGRIAFVFFLAFVSACYAGEDDKNGQSLSALTSTQLGEYSLKLDTDEPRQIATIPSGLTPLRQQTARPFLGLKLSRPLPDNFWNFGSNGNQPDSSDTRPNRY